MLAETVEYFSHFKSRLLQAVWNMCLLVSIGYDAAGRRDNLFTCWTQLLIQVVGSGAHSMWSDLEYSRPQK